MHPRLWFLWAAVAVLLVGGVIASVVSDEGPALTTTTTTTTTAAPLTPERIDAVVAELQEFVARARGLQFKQPVKATLLDDAAFRARLQEDEETDREELEKTTKTLRALKLLEEDVDLEKAIESLLGDAVLGFYDPEKDELVVRGAALTPNVRSTLVHELTHALQDQHFELDRDDLDDRDDEAGTAFDGLVEGDAVRIERDYVGTLSRREAREAEDAGPAPDFSDVPPVLLQSIAFPYVYGPRFVEELVEAGGNARVDEAFRRPPETSEQILHPAAYLQGDGLAVVAEPAAGGEVFDRGVVGEFGLYLILEAALDQQDLQRAIIGWDGDRYVSWEAGGRLCFRATVRMESERDARELRDGLRAWANEVGGVTVAFDTNPVEFTSCV
ncbi:MAG TPA: DUF6782 family putative metallopeptidase [Acidimicrobiales bacterium]|nr:DUF6782 family putative metallopeptidase [Acidimicrobiales bacterium]